MTGGDSGGPGSRIRDGRGQCDLLALELGEAGGDRGTGDGHRIFSISAGDFQRGGGGLTRRCSGRLRVQADVVLVFLQNAAGSVLRGLQIQTVMIFAERHDLCTELIAGVFTGHQIRRRVAGLRNRLPVVLVDLIVLPDDLVVLTEHRLFAVQRFHAGDLVGLDLERVGLACDHSIGNWCAGCAVALVDKQLACCCFANHPADRLREDADVHFIGLCTVGIAFISFGFEDSVVILVLRGGLVLANLHGEFRGHAVDGGRADLRTGCTGSCGLVELDRTLRTDIQRRLQSDGFTLILDDAVCRGRIGNIRDRQRHICALGFPHGIQRGIRCEFSSSTRLDLVNRVVGIRSICLAVGVPTEELVARADRDLLDDLVVVRYGVQIVLHSLCLGHIGHVIARIRIINDRHGFARDADDGDVGVFFRDELEGVGLAVCALVLGGEQLVVDADLHLRCVVAIEDRDGEGHHGVVGNGAAIGGQFHRVRCTGGGVLDLHGVAGRRGGPSDRRGDGRQLGVEFGVAGHLVGGEIPLVGISPTRVVLIPAAELVALDHGVNGLGGLVVKLHLLRLIGGAVGHERHGVGRVGSDLSVDRGVCCDVLQYVAVNLRAIARGGITGRNELWVRCIYRAGIYIDRRCILRIGGVDKKIEFKVFAMRHGHAADAMERIALAAAERDGVGLLLPHGVEGDIGLDLLREGRAGEVGRDGRAVGLAPTEEGVALLGGLFRSQRGRQTVGLRCGFS